MIMIMIIMMIMIILIIMIMIKIMIMIMIRNMIMMTKEYIAYLLVRKLQDWKYQQHYKKTFVAMIIMLAILQMMVVVSF